MLRFFILLIIVLLTGSLQATGYVKIWVNGEESSTVIQGDQFAWEFDVSVSGGSGTFALILDVNGNQSYDAGDLLLIEFTQTDGQEGNDGPGDGDGEENGVVYSPLGAFGFAPAHYIFQVTDDNDQSQAGTFFQVSALNEPAATIHGNISKTDVAPPSAELQNIMVLAQLSEGFAGFWTGLSDNQGNYNINLPDTAVGMVWNIELFNDDHGKYVVDDHYQDITIHAGPNTGFNFHFDKPSSFVYGRLVDDNAGDIIVNDYVFLENINTHDTYYSEIHDGKYNIPVIFEPGKNSAQFRIGLDGENLIPDYMIPQAWGNENLLVEVSNGDSLEKNIILQRSDEEIYVMITLEGSSPGMAFEFEAYDQNGFTKTTTNTDGWGVLSVKGKSNYYIMIRFDNDELGQVPEGYTLDGGPHLNGVAGDTVRFNIVQATSSISGSLTFDEADNNPGFDTADFFVDVQGQGWGNTLHRGFDEALQYKFDLADGSYTLWFNTNDEDFLAMPAQYNDLVLESTDLENIDFHLNYTHANLFLTLRNAEQIDPTNYHLDIYTEGDYPYIYHAWADGDQDSTFHFRVCDGKWIIDIPGADSTFTVSVSNEGLNYYAEFDYASQQITTALKTDIPWAEKFRLQQNYPNPFNPLTTITYQLAKNSKVSLVVYDIAGREIARLVNGLQAAGRYSVSFDASALSSGLYFYNLTTSAGFTETRRMLLVK